MLTVKKEEVKENMWQINLILYVMPPSRLKFSWRMIHSCRGVARSHMVVPALKREVLTTLLVAIKVRRMLIKKGNNFHIFIWWKFFINRQHSISHHGVNVCHWIISVVDVNIFMICTAHRYTKHCHSINFKWFENELAYALLVNMHGI